MRLGGQRLLIDSLYYGDTHCNCGHRHIHDAATVHFDINILDRYYRKLYDGKLQNNDIDYSVFREVLRIINEGTVEGLSRSGTPPTHEESFYSELRHSNEVFSAFKVHTMSEQMTAKLTRSDGTLKSFSEWKNDVESIASHQVGSWLRTEYDTAVIRAHSAADWREFERNKDVMPNLRWMPTTSSEPESSHAAYWRAKLTLPVDDPFWNSHHPGDRWNCKCSLEATDDPENRNALDEIEPTKPQRGLENNAGKDGHLFNDTHPYFPKNCNKCPFNYNKNKIRNKLKGIFINEKKDCFECSKIDRAISNNNATYIKDKDFGDRLLISTIADASEVERNTECAKSILRSFPDVKIKIRPHIYKLNFKNPEYEINGEIADRKGINGEKGVTSGFKKAKKQGCSVVVIDLDERLNRLNPSELAKYINNRKDDFIKGIMKDCYVVYKGKAVIVNPMKQSKQEIINALKEIEP